MQYKAEDEFAETGAVIAVFKELGITEDVVAKHQAMGEKIYKPKNLAELIALGKKYGATPEDLKKAPEIAKRFGIPEN